MVTHNADKGTELEILLRTWLDDDDACDVALWVTSEPEAVAEAAYQASQNGRSGSDA